MLKSYSESLVWPAVINPRSTRAFAYLTQIERSQWQAPQAFAQMQAMQLASRLRHAAQASSYFAPMLAGRQITWQNAHEVLMSLPLLTRTHMQTEKAGIHCKAPEDHGAVKTLRTSGSTGQPVEVQCTAACFDLRAALTIRSMGWRGLDLRKTFAAIRANVKTGTADNPAQYSGWGSHMSMIFHTGRAIGLPIQTPVADQLDFLHRFKPAYLLTYPSNLRALLDLSPEKPPSIECLITIGETMHRDIVEDVKRLWNVPLYDEYSSEELGPIATQCSHGSYHVCGETLIVEVIDDEGRPCEPGEIGRVVVTDIANFASAIVRYEIRDYAEVGEPCACNRVLPTLKRIVGRERNMMVLPGGARFWPQFGMRSDEALALVRQYQIVQTTPEHLDLKIVAARPLTEEDRRWLVSTIRKNTGHAFEISIEQVEGELPKGANGKLQTFTCLVAR